MTLLYTSCAVRLQPEVCECVRRLSDLSDFGLKFSFTSFAQIRRAARILATSMNVFMPMAQKKDRRGANASTSRPAATPARIYSMPSASV